MRTWRVFAESVTYLEYTHTHTLYLRISSCNNHAYNLTGIIDYYSGPYNVAFPAGETTVSFNILITDNDIIGGNKAFGLSIDSNTLPIGGARRYPYSVTVTIQNNDCKLLINIMHLFFYLHKLPIHHTKLYKQHRN